MCHALNVCLRSGMSIKYHELIRRCLESSPNAMKVVETCDSVVRLIKDKKGRMPNPRFTAMRKGLQNSKRQFHSYTKMLLSVRARFEDVRAYLREIGEGDRLAGITIEELDALVSFLSPIDFDGTREASSEVTAGAWPELLRHSTPLPEDEEDPDPVHPLTERMHSTLADELQLMSLVSVINRCKALVKFLKKSGLVHRLSKSTKQEIEVRWNSLLIMLCSIDDVWDEIVEVLGPENASKVEGIDRQEVQHLKGFLTPFLEESLKLEGEEYPTIPLAVLASSRLQRHCSKPVLPPPPDNDEGELDFLSEAQAEESRAYFLLRRNLAISLREKLQLTPSHTLATLLHPNYRRMMMLPPPERNKVLEHARAEIAALGGGHIDQPTQQPIKKTKLDDGYSDWSIDADGSLDDSGIDLHFPAFAEDEVDKYLREASTSSSENLLQWWQTEGAAFPRLQILARRVLAIPASSASSERLFSKAGFIINRKRTNLGTRTIDALIFLHHHYKKMRK